MTTDHVSDSYCQVSTALGTTDDQLVAEEQQAQAKAAAKRAKKQRQKAKKQQTQPVLHQGAEPSTKLTSDVDMPGAAGKVSDVPPHDTCGVASQSSAALTKPSADDSSKPPAAVADDAPLSHVADMRVVGSNVSDNAEGSQGVFRQTSTVLITPDDSIRAPSTNADAVQLSLAVNLAADSSSNIDSMLNTSFAINNSTSICSTSAGAVQAPHSPWWLTTHPEQPCEVKDLPAVSTSDHTVILHKALCCPITKVNIVLC